MSTKKSITKAMKKIAGMITAAALAFTVTLNFSQNTELKVSAAKNASRTLADGIYCIRNMNSGMYMDMCNNKNISGTNIVQYPYHGAMNQRFRVTYRINSLGESYYTIHPMNTYYDQYLSFDLESKAYSCTNGTDLKAYYSDSNNCAEQRFTIEPAAGGGYQIGTWASNGVKVLEVTSSSTRSGAQVQIWDYSSLRNNDNWFFEPAPTGLVYNIVTNNISADDISDAQVIKSKFCSLGYTGSVKKNVSKSQIINDAKNASVLVFHGHGNAGGVKTDVDGGWIIPVANPKAGKNCVPLKEIIPPETAQHLQLVYFAACNSGSVDPTYGISLADAAWQLGAKCAIGFDSTVAGAEDYLLKMMNYINSHKYATIQDAMNYADSTYSKTALKNYNCPVNCKHVVGDTSVILDLRLPG